MGDSGKYLQMLGRGSGEGAEDVVWGLARIPDSASLYGSPSPGNCLAHRALAPWFSMCLYNASTGRSKVTVGMAGEAHLAVDASCSWLASVLHGQGELGQAPGLSSSTFSSYKMRSDGNHENS